MKQSRIVIGFAAAFLLAGAAWADDASRMAKAQELLQVAKMDQGFKQMLDRAQVTVKAQTTRQVTVPADKAALEEKITPILAQQLNWDRLKAQYVKIYADTYTEEELDAILAFYKSPAGQAWFAKSPAVGEKARQITQQAIQDAQSQVRKLIDQAGAPQQ
ncbi:MAG TPA: DUF2059 domain-containing protein [Bryobacteraceae bacterium]|nr:DUF2059 domain-containing protein [Bryobacteraceae bacterium]